MEDNEKINHEEQHKEPKNDSQTDESHKLMRLTGMYKDWFLDYASYVILERAVPHLNDGLKPVQRRILHSMKRLDDGRYNKVANIIGHTMQFHPHGDASIGDALVQLGQKDLLIDTQGNWGNILTGDGSAAPRYIEARLSKFAIDVVFNPKTTEWQNSYDGRNKEPITLPIKFPLLLAQGVEGIAVGLASKILPHNFNELIDASIKHLKNEEFEIYPDFPTGGSVDVEKYNDGLRGGQIKVRAKISKLDKKTLVITEIPFGRTTTSLIDSILKANEKGKIKIRKVDDNTAQNVEIMVHLGSGVSPDKTIDALYAFTDCEVSISPNSCIIFEDRPHFMAVSEILKVSAKNTLNLLKLELEIKKSELEETWHMSSLEKIFIEERIYRDIEECETWESIIETIDKGLDPFKNMLMREVTVEDITKLTEIKIKRISKFDTKKADEYIKGIEEEIQEVKNHLAHIVDYTINYFEQIKKKHGKGRERKTEIRSFESIEATKVVVANTKIYADYKEGFIGTSLKKNEFVCDCSDIDDILVIKKDGSYLITKVAQKTFVGKDILHVSVFKKNDKRRIFNVVYRDGLNGNIMMKRCYITGLTRDKEYTLTKGTSGSRVLYMSVNPNGEAEVLKIYLKPRPRLRNLQFDLDFAEVAIKGKGSIGNILTKHAIHKISLKEKGTSTLGGRKIWFDDSVNRLNTEERGHFLGEFFGNDKILVITKQGQFRTSNFDLANHYDEDILRLEKFDSEKIYTAIFFDAEQGFIYLKRFVFEETEKLFSFIGEHESSKLLLIVDDYYPRIEVIFGGKHIHRDAEVVDADEFIAVKSFRARGKRLSSYEIDTVNRLEPNRFPDIEDESENSEEDDEPNFADGNSSSSQMSLEL